MTVDSREQLRSAARELDANDDIDGAIAVYEKLLARDPQDGESGYDLVQLYLEISRPDLAIERCRSNGGPVTDYRMAAALSAALLHLTRFSEAEHYANLAISLAPLAVESLAAKGSCLRVGGRTTEMRRLIATALETHPDDLRLLTLAAQSRSVLGTSQQQALRLAQRVLALAPRARVLRFMLLDDFGSLLTGRPVLEELRLLARRTPDNARLHLTIAYEENGSDPSSSLEHLALAEALAPHAYNLAFAHGHFAALADEKEKCLGFIKALEAYDQEPYELMRAQALLYLAAGQPDESLRKIQSMIAHDPTRWEGRSLEAYLLRHMGRLQQCMACHERMVIDFPDLDAVRLEAAEFFALESCIEEAEKALLGCSEELDADAARGIIAFNKGEFVKATHHFQRVLSSRPDMLDWLVCTYGKTHRFADIEALLAKENTDPALKMRYVDILIIEKADPAKALKILRELDSGAAIDWGRAANAAIQLDEYGLAQEFAERDAALHPDLSEPLCMLADIIALQGRTEEATAVFRRAHALNAGQVDVMAALGLHLAATREIPEAIELYRSAIAIANTPAHRVSLAWLLANKGDFHEAANLLASLSPEEMFDLNNAAGIALRCERFDLAEPFLTRAFAEDAVTADTHHFQARVLVQLGKREAAEGHYQKAIALAPDDYILSHNHALLLEEMGRMQEACLVFKGLTGLPALEHDALTRINLARMQLRCGDLPAALETARSAMDLDCASAHLALFAQLLNEAGYYADALAYCDDALRMFPEAVEIIIERASALRSAGRQQEACDWLAGLAPKHGGNATFNHALGLAWLAAGSPAKGLQCLQEAERIGGSADHACSLGKELLKRGDWRGANEAYCRAMGLARDRSDLITATWLTAYDECGLYEAGLASARQHPESGSLPAHRTMEGVFLLRLGRFAEAEVLLEQAVKEVDWAHDDYALCLLEQGRAMEALRVILPVVGTGQFHLQVLRTYLKILIAVGDNVAADEVRIVLARKVAV